MHTLDLVKIQKRKIQRFRNWLYGRWDTNLILCRSSVMLNIKHSLFLLKYKYRHISKRCYSAYVFGAKQIWIRKLDAKSPGRLSKSFGLKIRTHPLSEKKNVLQHNRGPSSPSIRQCYDFPRGFRGCAQFDTRDCRETLVSWVRLIGVVFLVWKVMS